MRYKILGRSGLRVSELGMGAMTFGDRVGYGCGLETSRKLFDIFVNAGGNFFDSADYYNEGSGSSEKCLGKFIAPDRDHFVVATKYSLFTRRGDPNFSGNHRKNMVRALDNSLERLNTDYIDLYWLHAWDFTTQVDEVMRALDDMVRQGKILHTGISDTPAWIVAQANTLAELRGWTPFTALQFPYSLIQRSVEAELLPMARSFNLAVVPWGVLGEGVLSGKYNGRQAAPEGRASARSAAVERNLSIAKEVIRVAGEIGCTPAQVATRWVASRPGVVIPLVGASKPQQLEDNLGAVNVTLSREYLERLDKISRIDRGFPAGFLNSEHVLDMLSGGTYERVDNHRKFEHGAPL